ncbi:BZ3500_MvSof-1268-A1-R1_Chr11-1g03147 [Microbotryum saponariae]|uniref:BZ3500_MvSof-1268-A1-R1_Chr11-1g03147 protein n=1 Tax=Microbotryum saponariae TaxID=289078 RepID=A0A2X0LD78_9BASI|nr:BZ3501_MvSof-1269-A2-R1_Chr11g02722 [Microbotryum saponariae]SDA03707.1 BZ3500_MvSof-1268-A1-R1_Chr11-1g03147 [Microbotryum saponariae]
MSRSSKAFFGLSLVIAVASIGGVHLSQYQERQTMFAGVLRDDARLAAKRQARQAEFEEQRRKQAYLETVQTLPSSSSTSTGVGVGVGEGRGVRVMSREEAEGVDWACKECERR